MKVLLTPIQQKVYHYIKNTIDQKAYAPSLSEIAQGIGIQSKSSISRHVQALAKMGLITFDSSSHRSIRLSDTSAAVPLLGRIAAGQPIEAILDVVETLDLSSLFSRAHFALIVKGDSMRDEGILESDIILCERREQAKNGEIVVALIDQTETTLKRFYQKTNGIVTLVPANPDFTAMVYEAHRIQIQGVLVGLIRK